MGGAHRCQTGSTRLDNAQRVPTNELRPEERAGSNHPPLPKLPIPLHPYMPLLSLGKYMVFARPRLLEMLCLLAGFAKILAAAAAVALYDKNFILASQSIDFQRENLAFFCPFFASFHTHSPASLLGVGLTFSASRFPAACAHPLEDCIKTGAAHLLGCARARKDPWTPRGGSWRSWGRGAAGGQQRTSRRR